MSTENSFGQFVIDAFKHYIIEPEDNRIYFEPVTKYACAGLALPERKTSAAAGYDFVCAEDTIIQPYDVLMSDLIAYSGLNIFDTKPISLDDMANLTKGSGARPTLVPTGMKCHMPKNCYLELTVRSSCPLKYWLILANGTGIIDADYYDCDGHIQFQLINLSPFPIIIHKGDIIGQGIIKPYLTTDMDTGNETKREGGFGSTNGQHLSS